MLGEILLLAMLVALPDPPPPQDTPVMEPWAPDPAHPPPPAARPAPAPPPPGDPRDADPADDQAGRRDDGKITPADGRLHPLLWGAMGMAAGTALGLGIATPLGLLVGTLSAITSFQTLTGRGAVAGRTPPLQLFQLLVAPLTACVTLTCCGYLLFGAGAAGILSGVVTMLGSAYQGKRKMPWVPTLAATIIPRWLGTLGGSCAWMGASCAVSLVTAAFVLSAMLQGNFNNATAFLSSPAYFALNCLLSAACPVAVLGGSALGDLVGLALLWPINANLSRDVEADENPLPKAMLQEEELDDGEDEDAEEEDRPRKKKLKQPRKRRRRTREEEDDDEDDGDLDDG